MSEFIQSFHFIRPAFLLAFIPAFAIWWLLQKSSDPRRSMLGDIAPHLLDRLVVRPKNRPKLRPLNLLLPVWLLGTIAAAGPSYQLETSPFAEDKSILMIVVKISESMLSEDLQPTRLERVRLKVHDLLEMREGAATGLVAYSGSAHLVMPPTVDGGVIEHMLESLDPQIMPREGDALDQAVSLADQRIERNETPGSILVITDSIEPAAASGLEAWREKSKTVVQFLVPIASDTPLESTLVEPAAAKIRAPVQPITIDDSDISTLNRRADSSIVMASGNQTQRWRDDGYWLIPLIVIGMAFWSRRGWSVAPK
ncbi:MAG: VWA domain-containing protein [Mariniblastus sp.]|nr:VWA domain-containing protein [Mariniblastus sp.]